MSKSKETRRVDISERSLLGNEQETGRAVRSAVRGAGGDLRAQRDAPLLASRPARLDPSHRWLHAQLPVIGVTSGRQASLSRFRIVAAERAEDVEVIPRRSTEKR